MIPSKLTKYAGIDQHLVTIDDHHLLTIDHHLLTIDVEGSSSTFSACFISVSAVSTVYQSLWNEVGRVKCVKC
jgi:hypothetical protein